MFLKKILSSIAIASSILGLGACKKHQLVIIKYTQPANCYIFDNNPGGSPHTTTSAGNGMFMIYKISSIQNTEADAVDFNFKLSKIFASNPNEVPGTIPIVPTAQTAPDTKLVPKGTTASNLGRFVIIVGGCCVAGIVASGSEEDNSTCPFRKAVVLVCWKPTGNRSDRRDNAKSFY